MLDIDVSAATAILAAVLGLLAPLIIAAINRPSWSDNLKRAVAVAIAIGLAVLAIFITDGFHGSWGLIIPAVIGVAQFVYAVIYKPAGVTDAVDRATNPKASDPTELNGGDTGPVEPDAHQVLIKAVEDFRGQLNETVAALVKTEIDSRFSNTTSFGDSPPSPQIR